MRPLRTHYAGAPVMFNSVLLEACATGCYVTHRRGPSRRVDGQGALTSS